MSDLEEQYTREEIDPMKLYDTHGETGLHTQRNNQLYESLQKEQELTGEDIWDSLSSYTGTYRPIRSTVKSDINYDHGFWADVSDELGLWWHGLVLDDNEFTNTWFQGTKQWWQQDPEMDFNPYLEDQGYEKYRHLWKNVRTREHFEYLKAKIDNHLASRARLEATDRQFGPALMAGVFDPINFIALPYVKGLGIAHKFIKGGAVVGGSVAATEFLRRPLDPTSTAEESAFYIGGAFLLGGGLTAALGGRGFRGTVNKNNNEPDMKNMSEPDIQVENMNKVDHTESGLHTADRELDAHTNNHLIYSPKDYEPHMDLVEGPITTNKNKYVPTERDNNLIEINNVFKDVYEKLRESDIGRKTKTFLDLSQRTPRSVVKTAPEVMDEHMRMGQIFSTREGQLELAKALKNKGLLKEYRNIINEQNNVQPSFKGFNFKKLGFNKVEEARFKHIMGDHVKQGKAIRKELHELDAIDKKLDDPNFLRKAESWSEAFTDKDIPIPRYMEKQIDQMSNEPLTKFKEELVPDAPDTIKLEKDLGIEIQKMRDFIATLKAKKTDELNTLYSHGTITDKTMDDFYTFEQRRDAIGEIDKITSKESPIKPNKVTAVVGSRLKYFKGKTQEEVNEIVAKELDARGPHKAIVSGESPGKGVDIAAKVYAKNRPGVEYIAKPPASNTRNAYMARNQEIVDEAEQVIAITMGSTPGTANTISRTKTAKKPLEVIDLTKQTKAKSVAKEDVPIEFVDRFPDKPDPNKTYIFGDNLAGVGRGPRSGQAVIRDWKNSYGIPTKVSPNEFMSDLNFASNAAAIDAAIAKIPRDKPIVMSSYGLGTGRADLKAKAPKTYAYLQKRLKENGLIPGERTAQAVGEVVKKWTKEEIMEQEIRAFDSPERTMQNNFDNLTGVQRFVKAIQEQVQQITKLTNTTSNTRSRFVKYNPRTGVMQRDTGSIKVIYDNKEYLKPDGKGVNPLPAGEFRNWLDYLNFRTHKEILRHTRFRKDELVIDTPINIVTKSKKREGGGVKHAWFDKNKQEINVNKQAILDDFKNKPWTVAKTKGVKPYPEEQFKTPDEWYDFVLKHEKMHTLHKRKKNESVGEYENRINELALHRPNPIFKTTVEYQNALNKKTLDDLRENKFKDYSEDIPMWATEISQFQSQYGWLINLQKKLPNMKTTPIIGSMITRLAGTHGVPMRMAMHGLVAPPSALVRINTEFAAKFRELTEAIDNAYVRVNMSNKDPMNWMGFNVSKASLVARDVFRNKVVNPALEKAGKDKQKARVVNEDQVNEAIGRGVIDPEFRAKLPKELHEPIDAIINYNKFIDEIFKKHKAYVSAGGYEKVLLSKQNRSIEIGNIIRSNNARTTNKIPEEAINELKIKKEKLDEQVKQLKETHERYVKDQEKRKKAGLHNPEDFEDFFPRVWNLTKVMQDEEGLRKILFQHYSENQKLLRPYTRIDKTTGELTQIEKVADMEGYAGVVWYEKLPGKKPERKFISKKDKKYADKIEELKSKEIKFKEVEKKPGEEILEAKAAGQAQMPGLKARIERQINEDMETIIRQAEDGESLNVGGLGIDNFGKYVSGTTTLMSRKIDIPNKKIMDYLQLDAKVTMNNYRQKVAPAAAIMDAFGSHHMDDALDVLEIEMLAQDLGRNMTKQDVDDVITSFVDIKDKMMGMYNLENASSLNKRMANFLGNWAQLAMMGKVAFAALPDIGKMIMSQGLNKTFSKGFGGYFKYTDQQLKAVKNLRQMGIATDIVLGQMKRRYVEDTGTTMWGGPTSNLAEKIFNKVGQKFDDWVGGYYLLNGLAFHTTFHKEVTGLVAADTLIRLSIKTAGGKATKEDIKTLAHHMIDEDTAKLIAKMPYEKTGADLGNIPGVGERALETKTILGTVDDDILYTANVREWTGPGSEAARTRFRNAVWGETNRSIVTPDVSDTPSLMHGGMRIRDPEVRKELEGSELGEFIGYRPDERGGKIHNAMLARPFQFFSWGMAANRKIVMSGLSGREADYISGIIAMVSLGYIADYLKNPRYHAHKSTEEKIIRAVELSGIGGMITDMNFLTEQITGGLFNYPMGLRPLIGIEPRFGQPKAHDALGEFVGAGPSIPIDILYHMFGDDVTYEQRQNLSRRLIPGATLAWTDGLFKKIYNSTTDAIFR
tara:strand:- start:1775 stop:8185 length:6411 start_codon:yes stop_codon:yes gene_type:complete